MVYSVETGDGGRVTRELVMAMGAERSKPPLHNFNLPYLKWGNQRHLRCMKVTADSGVSADRRIRSNRSPQSISAARDYDIRRLKRPSGGVHEGIAEVREKLMFDFKAAADKMKDAIFRKRTGAEEEEEEEPSSTPPPTAAAEAGQEVRPWNLRTRRAACKVPEAGNSITEKKINSNASPSRSESAKSPRMRGEKKEREEKEEKQERAKFAVALSRKELEEDFMEMLGHRPARRPKKRPRNVQRQLDLLFPGLWLTEVSIDNYKVPESPDNGKR